MSPALSSKQWFTQVLAVQEMLLYILKNQPKYIGGTMDTRANGVVDTLQKIVESNAVLENLRSAKISLDKEMLWIKKSKKNLYLSNSIELTINWIIDKEKTRPADQEEEGNDFYNLCNVSEVGAHNDHVKDEETIGVNPLPTTKNRKKNVQHADRCVRGHQRWVHEKDPAEKDKRPFKCEKCGKDFRREDYLKGNIQTQHGEDLSVKRPFACHEFPKRFPSKYLLKAHKNDHFAKDDPLKKKFVCDICGLALANKQSLNKHKCSHANLLKVQCEKCGKMFANKSNLKAHMSMHTGEFQYKCQFCPRLYNSKSRLKIHQECDGRGTNKVSFRRIQFCTLCPRRFEREFELAAHLKRHEDGTVGDSTDSEADPDRFRCKLCGQSYTTLGNLRGHVKIVHGENSKYYVSIRPNLNLSNARKHRREESDSDSEDESDGGAWSDDMESNDS